MLKRDREEESDVDPDPAVQAAMDEELLSACARGTLEEVKAAVRKGASLMALRGRRG